MSSLLGIEASRAAQYVIAFAIILVLVALFGLVLRKLTGGRLMIPGHDRGRSRQPRLGVVDIYDLDRQRQLVLLRRDNVEHLLLIGGLNDVVIETNIVRVAGARIPAPVAENAPERFEPTFDQTARPQVEPAARPSIETQLAAQLGAFIRRPPEESEIDQELAPIASVTAPAPAHPEPILKPDHVTVTSASSVEPLPSHPQPQPQPSSFLRAPATPAFQAPDLRPEPRPEPPRPEPRPTIVPPPFQSRPTPVPPSSAAFTPAPEVVRPVQPEAGEAKTPDAAILSDMAKQLEEALKRPAQPVPPPSIAPAPVAIEEEPEREQIVAHAELDEDELLEPPVAPETEEPASHAAPAAEKIEPRHPIPEPVRPAAPPHPAAPPPPAPAQPAPVQKVSDPFSVEEIEAEFARLLGRPRSPDSKS